jgi:hypothetical protein
MASRKRPQSRQNEYQSGDFDPPYGDTKKGRENVKTAHRSDSPSSSGSTSSSCIDDTVGHMNAARGDLLVGRCKLYIYIYVYMSTLLRHFHNTKTVTSVVNHSRL